MSSRRERRAIGVYPPLAIHPTAEQCSLRASEAIESSHGSLPFAVVSASTRESVTASLESLSLLEKFETLVCAGDYQRSKPHPEAFLLAAERLRVAPANCLVFEDTAMGIQPQPPLEWPPSKCSSHGSEPSTAEPLRARNVFASRRKTLLS